MSIGSGMHEKHGENTHLAHICTDLARQEVTAGLNVPVDSVARWVKHARGMDELEDGCAMGNFVPVGAAASTHPPTDGGRCVNILLTSG